MKQRRELDRSRSALVVLAHPVPDSFIAASARRVTAGLEAAGYVVHTIDLYADQFDPVLSVEEWEGMTRGSALPDVKVSQAGAGMLATHRDLLRTVDSLVLVYPTWFGAQPAILKGWFERVWVEGVAYRRPSDGGHIRPMLRNVRSLSVVTSHGSSWLMNTISGAAGRRVVMRGLRSLCHPTCRRHWIAFYNNDRATDGDRRAFLARVEHKARTI